MVGVTPRELLERGERAGLLGGRELGEERGAE
jgi:hypothetical protein